MMLVKATDDTQKKFENWGDSETIIIYIGILTGLFKFFFRNEWELTQVNAFSKKIDKK